MSDSISQNNIFNKTFGLNIAHTKQTLEKVQKAAEHELENISLNPFNEYFEENDKVFSGEVAKEIQKYQAQMYAMGQVMREGQPTSSFNIKV